MMWLFHAWKTLLQKELIQQMCFNFLCAFFLSLEVCLIETSATFKDKRVGIVSIR